MDTWVRVCSLGDITEGQILPIECNNAQLMLVLADQKIYVADRMCTHADADLSTGFIAPDAGNAKSPGVRCPLHFSVFDMATGIPLNPPAEKKLHTYNVKIDKDSVYVEVSN